MEKREKKRIVNYISIILLIFVGGFVLFSFLRAPSEKGGFLGNLKGELATLIGPGEILLPDGLVAYYKFDGNARDAVGSHDGIPHNVKVVDGVYNKAYEFDTSGDYILGSPDYLDEDYINIPFKRGDSLDFSNKKEITTSFWLDLYDIPISNDNGSRPLYWEYHSTAYLDDRIEWFAERYMGNYYKISFRIINEKYGITKAVCSQIIRYNGWHLITGTYKDGDTKIYLDGELCGQEYIEGVISPTSSGDDWIVSDAVADKNLGIVGRMDELRIYNRALSNAEIALLYLGGLDVDVERYFMPIANSPNNYYVTLHISTSTLPGNEIMMITEKVPEGFSFNYGGWNVEPSYIINDTLVWLLANNPPIYYGYINVSEPIPRSITYTAYGTGNNKFKGKWGLKVLDIDGFVDGPDSL